MSARVMIFVRDLRSTGVVRNALALASRLGSEHEVVLAAGCADGFFAEEAGRGPFRTVALRTGGVAGAPIPAALSLRRLINAERPDILLSAGNFGHWVVRLACLGRRRPRRIYRISNRIDRGSGATAWLRGMAARLIAADADALALVGQDNAGSPAFRAASARGRITIVANGVDIRRARALAAAPTPAPLLVSGPPLLLAIGRLHPQKDFPTLVRAAARAARRQPLRLAILGGGSHDAATHLEHIAREEGFDGLLLAGETDNVFAWLSRADAFALTSRWEGSSMALLEAMALDVPVIATRQAGDAAAVLADGRHGRLVEAGDVDGIATAICAQLGPDAIRPGDRILDFSAERSLETYADIVTRLLRPARVRQRTRRTLAGAT